MDNGSAMEALWERIAWMEEVLREWPSEDDSVASWVEHTMKEIQVQRSLLKMHDQFFEEKVASLKVDIQSLMDHFKSTLQSYGEDIVVLKNAVLQGSSSGSKSPPKIRVLEPKGFNGNKNAKQFENFLWGMKQFFKAAYVSDGEKVFITSMYLTGDAKLWW